MGEQEKNATMLDIINRIKKKSPTKPTTTLCKIDLNIPTLKPMAFNGNLKINLNTKLSSKEMTKEERLQKQKAKHEAADNGAKKRKKQKKLLQAKLANKRKQEMQRHEEAFGKEED